MKSSWILPLALAVTLAACGGSTEGGGSDTLRIAVIPKGTTHEFWKSVHAGAAQAAEELGVEIFWKGPLQEGRPRRPDQGGRGLHHRAGSTASC